jgi:predicted XRE-type DNA-binding protein
MAMAGHLWRHATLLQAAIAAILHVPNKKISIFTRL